MHRAIVVVDVEGFGRRTNPDQVRLRDFLFTAVAESLRGAGVSRDQYDVLDRGDGVLVLAAPEVPKNRLPVEFVRTLNAQLNEYNIGRAGRVRVRIALHAGEVVRDERGFVGDALVTATRLADSAVVRSALQLTDADVVVAVTEPMFRGVIEPGPPGIDPESFRPVVVEAKETHIRGWIHVPGVTGPPPEEPPGAQWRSDDLHHRAIFLVDIEDSGSRPDEIKGRLRAALRRMVLSSIDAAGIEPDQYEPPTDEGDGLRVLFLPQVPKNRLVSPFMTALTRELFTYNESAPAGEHMRLRTVLDAGELRRDSYDYFGSALDDAYGLADSDELRFFLKRTDWPLGLMVSEEIYDGVVRHGYGDIDPGSYEPFTVRLKHRDVDAWCHEPGRPPRDR